MMPENRKEFILFSLLQLAKVWIMNCHFIHKRLNITTKFTFKEKFSAPIFKIKSKFYKRHRLKCLKKNDL